MNTLLTLRLGSDFNFSSAIDTENVANSKMRTTRFSNEIIDTSKIILTPKTFVFFKTL
jgi:hypothetical protein